MKHLFLTLILMTIVSCASNSKPHSHTQMSKRVRMVAMKPVGCEFIRPASYRDLQDARYTALYLGGDTIKTYTPTQGDVYKCRKGKSLLTLAKEMVRTKDN